MTMLYPAAEGLSSPSLSRREQIMLSAFAGLLAGAPRNEDGTLAVLPHSLAMDARQAVDAFEFYALSLGGL